MPLAKRWVSHKSDAKRRSKTIFSCALRDEGEAAFELVEIDRADSQEELDYMERYWIKRYQATESGYGYNIRDGGGHGKHSPESRRRMSAAQKAHPFKRRSPATEFKPGQTPHNKGKSHSAEARMKMSVSQRRCVAEGRVNGTKGTTFSPERRQRHSAMMKARYAAGAVPANKGLPMSETQKRLMSEARKGKSMPKTRRAVMCVETGERFDGIVVAAAHLALTRPVSAHSIHGSIVHALRRIRKDGNPCTAFGQHWKYVDSLP